MHREIFDIPPLPDGYAELTRRLAEASSSPCEYCEYLYDRSQGQDSHLCVEEAHAENCAWEQEQQQTIARMAPGAFLQQGREGGEK